VRLSAVGCEPLLRRKMRRRCVEICVALRHGDLGPVPLHGRGPHPFVALPLASSYAQIVIAGVGLQLVIRDPGLADEPENQPDAS